MDQSNANLLRKPWFVGETQEARDLERDLRITNLIWRVSYKVGVPDYAHMLWLRIWRQNLKFDSVGL